MEAIISELDPFDRATARQYEQTIGQIGRWTDIGDLRWITEHRERYSSQFAEAARQEMQRRGLLVA